MNFKEDIKIIGIKGIPLIKKGDKITDIIIDALNKNEISLEDRDIIIILEV